jgi:hypothetical protein
MPPTSEPRPLPLRERGRRLLESPRLALVLAVLAALLVVNTVTFGLQSDDLFHRQILLGNGRWSHLLASPWDMFTFMSGDPARMAPLIDDGIWPWWTDLTARLAFFRPVAALTHIIDYALFPSSPELMHAHSIAWFAALVAMATVTYRRILGGLTWPAGLAAVFYAFDHTHGMPVAWVANRNALIAAFFGLAALVAHVRAYDAREKPSWLARAGAPVLLLLALYAGESALAAVVYLVAYELVLSERSWRESLRVLAPCGLALVAWAVPYKLGHYGASFAIYTDPFRDPGVFVGAVFTRWPLLMASEVGWIVPDFYVITPVAQRWILVLLAYVVVALVLFACRDVLRRRKEARFFALAAAVSVLPSCSAFPSSRLLLLPGFGLLGFAAVAVGEAWETPARLGHKAALPLRIFAMWNFVTHVFLGPPSIQTTTPILRNAGKVVDSFLASVGNDPALASQRLVVVNAAEPINTAYLLLELVDRHRVAPRAVLGMAPGFLAMDVQRKDASTLTVRTDGPLDYLLVNSLTHEVKLTMGKVIQLSDVRIEITHVLPDGNADGADFRFAKPLEDPSLRFVRWEKTKLVPFALPPLGETVHIDGQPFPRE